MTMFATIVNRGNRTGDILTVRKGQKAHRLKRGEQVTLDIGFGGAETVLLDAMNTGAPDDTYEGQPVVTVDTLNPDRSV